jgi:hypothetical protein
MYLVYNMNQIRQSFNESKKSIVSYKKDQNSYSTVLCRFERSFVSLIIIGFPYIFEVLLINLMSFENEEI